MLASISASFSISFSHFCTDYVLILTPLENKVRVRFSKFDLLLSLFLLELGNLLQSAFGRLISIDPAMAACHVTFAIENSDKALSRLRTVARWIFTKAFGSAVHVVRLALVTQQAGC
jgi:hypothetical protein